jgi:4-hydroxy-4-methyl-2-oxoglutarate aldolase
VTDGPVVYRKVRRLDAALLERARECSVSDLHEVLGADAGDRATMSARMRPLALGIRMAGCAVTVRPAPGDNLMLHRALALAQRGDVLVVAADGVPAAYWGELAALQAARIGLAGVVVHGNIRDADALLALSYPVWSTAIHPAHPEKKGAGQVNVPVTCDGVRVVPGDLVVGDGDGVIVIPREQAAAAIALTLHRAADEKAAAKQIAQGASLWDLHGLAGRYAKLGIPEHDEEWDGED